MTLAGLDGERTGAVVCARLSGEIDMSNAEELREALSAMTPNDALGLVLDLSAVDYIDSAGIHLVYRLRDALKARGQALRLVVPGTSIVNDTLRLAGIERGTDIAQTAQEARRAIDPGLDD